MRFHLPARDAPNGGTLLLTADDKAWITAQLARVETALSTKFHKWASSVEMRPPTHAAALRVIDLEMEAISDRVKKLEAS